MIELDELIMDETAKRRTVIMLDNVRNFSAFGDEASIIKFIDGSHIFVAQTVSEIMARIEHASIKSLATA